MNKQLGVTLVELLVGLVILSAVMMTAVPLTSSWVNSAMVRDAQALLQQAYGRTKALGLANPAAIKTGEAAAYMCVANAHLYVQPINAGTCGTGYAWGAELKSGVSITVSGAGQFSCLGMDARGVPVALTLGESTCTTSKALTVSKGNQNDSTTLY